MRRWDLGQGSLFFLLYQSFFQAAVQSVLIIQNVCPWREMVLVESVSECSHSPWLFSLTPCLCTERASNLCFLSGKTSGRVSQQPAETARFSVWAQCEPVGPSVLQVDPGVPLGKTSTLACRCFAISCLTSLNPGYLSQVWPQFPLSFIFLFIYLSLARRVIACGMHFVNSALSNVFCSPHCLSLAFQKRPMLCLGTQVSQGPLLVDGVILTSHWRGPKILLLWHLTRQWYLLKDLMLSYFCLCLTE